MERGAEKSSAPSELLDVSLFGPQGSIAGKPPSPFIEVGDGFLIPAGAQIDSRQEHVGTGRT
jgi:hypothetical protein